MEKDTTDSEHVDKNKEAEIANSIVEVLTSVNEMNTNLETQLEVAKSEILAHKENNRIHMREKENMKKQLDHLMARSKKHDRKVYKAQAEEKDAKRKMNEAINEMKRWQHKVEHRDKVIEGNDNILEKKNKELKVKGDSIATLIKEKDEWRKKWVKEKDEHQKTTELLTKALEDMDEANQKLGREMERALKAETKLSRLMIKNKIAEEKPKEPKKKRRSWLSRR